MQWCIIWIFYIKQHSNLNRTRPRRLTTDNCQFCSWSADPTGLHTLRCLQVCRLYRPANSTPYYRWLPVLQVYRLYRSTGLQTLPLTMDDCQFYSLYKKTLGLLMWHVWALFGMPPTVVVPPPCTFPFLHPVSSTPLQPLVPVVPFLIM